MTFQSGLALKQMEDTLNKVIVLVTVWIKEAKTRGILNNPVRRAKFWKTWVKGGVSALTDSRKKFLIHMIYILLAKWLYFDVYNAKTNRQKYNFLFLCEKIDFFNFSSKIFFEAKTRWTRAGSNLRHLLQSADAQPTEPWWQILIRESNSSNFKCIS